MGGAKRTGGGWEGKTSDRQWIPADWQPRPPLNLTPERAQQLAAIVLLQTANFTDVDHIEIRADSVALVLR